MRTLGVRLLAVRGFLTGGNQLLGTNSGQGGNVQPPRTVPLGPKCSF